MKALIVITSKANYFSRFFLLQQIWVCSSTARLEPAWNGSTICYSTSFTRRCGPTGSQLRGRLEYYVFIFTSHCSSTTNWFKSSHWLCQHVSDLSFLHSTTIFWFLSCVAWLFCRDHFWSAKPQAKFALAPISLRFLCPRPLLLLCAPNQNRHATQTIWFFSFPTSWTESPFVFISLILREEYVCGVAGGVFHDDGDEVNDRGVVDYDDHHDSNDGDNVDCNDGCDFGDHGNNRDFKIQRRDGDENV